MAGQSKTSAKGQTQLKTETANWARLIDAVAAVLKLREGKASLANH
jgi:hypothetical protein